MIYYHLSLCISPTLHSLSPFTLFLAILTFVFTAVRYNFCIIFLYFSFCPAFSVSPSTLLPSHSFLYIILFFFILLFAVTLIHFHVYFNLLSSITLYFPFILHAMSLLSRYSWLFLPLYLIFTPVTFNLQYSITFYFSFYPAFSVSPFTLFLVILSLVFLFLLHSPLIYNILHFFSAFLLLSCIHCLSFHVILTLVFTPVSPTLLI